MRTITLDELYSLPVGTCFSPKQQTGRGVNPMLWVLKGFVRNNPAPPCLGLDPRGFLYARAADLRFAEPVIAGETRTWYPDREWTRYKFVVYDESEIRGLVEMLDLPPIHIPYLPYLSDRADGVKGHYAIARWHPGGYREVWNLHTHEWTAFSDDVLTLDQATALLKDLIIPTKKTP